MQRGHSNNIEDIVELEADQFVLILPLWAGDRQKLSVVCFSSMNRRDTYTPSQNLS